VKQAMLIIYVSPNGRDGWKPLLSDAVPEWVKAPDIMGRLVAGEMCMDAAQGTSGSDWFKAMRVLPHAEYLKVQAAHKTRDAKQRRLGKLIGDATERAADIVH